jgi:hypothetical protein
MAQQPGGPVTRSAAVVVAVTLQRLVDDATRFWSVEERLVLDALRRSSSNLTDASVAELASYVAGMTPEQLRGLASNVKGIYHELLFVHANNIDGDEVTARVFEATNYPGADVEFLVDGEVIRSVQLKAVASTSSIVAHFQRYPDVELLVTSEVAQQIEGIESSGFSNVALGENVRGVFDGLPGDSLARDLTDGVATSALVSGAFMAAKALRTGQVTNAELKRAFGGLAVGAVSAVVLDTLLDGLA